MKIIILIFSILTLLSCGNDNEQDKSIITENATIYYYLDPEFGGSQCRSVIETAGGNIYIPRYNSLTENKIGTVIVGEVNKLEVKISYRLTEDNLDRCFHKEGFLTTPTVIVETISIKRREATLPTRN